MNRPLLGLLLGALIGGLDGASAFFTSPAYHDQLAGIVFGSSIKGLIAGLVTGLIARRTGSLARGIVIGLLAAVALALPVAYMNATHYEDPSIYWKIIAPGAVTGMLVGYCIVRFGRPPAGARSA